MKKILFNLLILVLLGNTAAFAQEDSVLRQQLRGKQNYTDIMNTVNTYFKDPETLNRLGERSLNRNIKQWKRWDWFMSSRLGPNGEFVNINQKMIEATGLQQNRKLQTAGNFSNLSQITAGDWALVGPTNITTGIGRVDRLAFHPTDANTVYAGSAGGGLWKTTNAGITWTNLTPDIPCLGISGISIDPNNPNTIYILTGDGDSNSAGGGLVEGFGYMRLSIGVLKSTNGGANWTATGVFPGADYSNLVSYRLTMHPTDPDILFACTNQGIFRTTDGGATWNLVDDRGMFFNLVFKPGSSTVCYAISMDAGVSKFFRSTDGGIIFSYLVDVTPQINNPSARCDIAVAPSNSSVVYILAGGVQINGFYKGLYRSDDSGLNFVQQSNSPNILGRSNVGADNNSQSWYDLTVAVSNTTSNTVAIGAIFVWRSLDAGNTWAFRGNLHGDIHQLGFHPVDNKLWAATDGGVYSSTDNGASWTSHFEGMSISQLYRMAVSPDDYLDMLGGLQDNGAIQRDNGTSAFTQFNNSDGFTVGYDKADATVYYAIINQGINRFTNNGLNAVTITPGGSNQPFASTLAIHPTAANTIYLASNGFWRSSNAISQNNWNVNPNVQGGWAIQTCPSNGNRIYMAGGAQFNSTNGVLRRSDDAGVTWPNGNILSGNNGFPTTFPKITYINVDPTNSSRVWVTFGGYTENVKVYYSSDAGANWVNRSGTLPNLPVNCIALDNNNNAYIGTDNGVYYRGTGMTDWVPFYNNMPYVPVTDLAISEANNRIRASTFGRGIWASEMYSNCETDLNITGTLEGQEFYEASNNIASTASLLTSAGSKVQMRGGNEVVLQAGFTARETTQFRAAIGPCGSGGVAGFLVRENDSSSNSLPPQQYLPPNGGKRSLLHIISVSGNEVRFEVNQKQNGVSDLLLTDEAGKIISSKNLAASIKGKWNNTISTAGLEPGLYYLQVLLDKRVEHMQEVIIQ